MFFLPGLEDSYEDGWVVQSKGVLGKGYWGLVKDFLLIRPLPVQHSCSVTACGQDRLLGDFTVERTQSSFTCVPFSLGH